MGTAPVSSAAGVGSADSGAPFAAGVAEECAASNSAVAE